LCLVFSLVMMYNCVFPLGAVWQSDGIVEPDCAQMIWNLWHVEESLAGGHNPYASALIYYPTGAPNLSHHSLAAGFVPVTFIIKKLTGASPLSPLYAYRLLILLCFTLLLYFSYWLLLELGCSAWAAAIASVAYSFSDFYMEHVTHLNMLAGFFIPLAALSLVRLYRQPERFSNIVGAALVLSSAIYFTEFTLFIHLGLLLFVLLMWLSQTERQTLQTKLRQAGRRRLLPGLAIYCLIIAPFIFLLLTDDFIKPPAGETALYSANLAGFFTPNPARTPLYGQLFAGLGARITTGIGGYEVFTSFLLMASAVVALWKWKRRWMRAAAILALVFYVLSLGPTLKILSLETGIPMPYALLMRLPPFDANRTPSRFVVMGLFFLMIVAACGLTWINRSLAERRGRSLSFVVMLLLFVWATAEAYSPTPPQPMVIAPPGVEQIIAGPVLNLPLLEADGYALFLQLFHRQPISTGYLARGSLQRHAQFETFRRLLEKGGAELCDEAERMGFRNLVIAPDAYWSRRAPASVPIDFTQCRLNVVDLRRRDSATTARGDSDALWILPPQPQSFPLVAAGTRIELSQPESDSFLWYGWSGREPYSRWTEQGRAALVFTLAETGPLVLNIMMAPYLAQDKLAAQPVKVSLNGETLRTLVLDAPEAKVYSIQLPRTLLRERNVLGFEMPDAESPQRLGTGDDARRLGINVRWIEWSAQSAGK
jgi:hypothetical protein